MSEISETWVLQARFPDDDRWETLGGFTYLTREKLQDAYDEHFSAGRTGLMYRFARVIVATDITYHEPAQSQT